MGEGGGGCLRTERLAFRVLYFSHFQSKKAKKYNSAHDDASANLLNGLRVSKGTALMCITGQKIENLSTRTETGINTTICP